MLTRVTLARSVAASIDQSTRPRRRGPASFTASQNVPVGYAHNPHTPNSVLSPPLRLYDQTPPPCTRQPPGPAAGHYHQRLKRPELPVYGWLSARAYAPGSLRFTVTPTCPPAQGWTTGGHARCALGRMVYLTTARIICDRCLEVF